MDPRPAATVVVARPSEPGVEVLVLRRAPRTPFAPGFLVFPGGLVEPDDRDLAVHLFGDPDEAGRACAVRELYEETALLLTASGLEERDARERIENVAFSPPAATALVEMARWVAPEFLEARFDAGFFAVGSPGGLRPRPDGREIDRAWWARPADIVAEHASGDRSLMWPTLATLRELARCGSVEDVLALRMEQQLPPPGWTVAPRPTGGPA